MSSSRMSDVDGMLHYEAFKPFLAAIPKSNRTQEAVEDMAVKFMKLYEQTYGTPMSETIFEAFCKAVVTEVFYYKLWPVASNAAAKVTVKCEATVEDLVATTAKMESVNWGDMEFEQAELDSDNEYVYDVPAALVASADPWAVSEAEALDGFTVPDLTLRKGIWTAFPVILKPVDDFDGTARYSIDWHWDNLDASFETQGRNLDLLEWEDILRQRLFYSLRAFSNKYTIEPARDANQLCVISMVHLPRSEVVEEIATAVPAAARHGVRRALDILKMAPVSWDREGAKHTVKPHNKKCKELGLSEAAVKKDLLAALATCGDCVVTASNIKGILCIVTML